MNKFEKSLRFISSKITKDSPFYGQIYLVGGCVRDELLGERYSDLDLLINLPNGQRQFVEYMCATFPETCKGPFYYQRYGTTAMDVIIDGSLTLVECVEPHIEAYAEDGVTLLETRFCSLEEDAMRRDYTCNALYKNLSTGQIIDPTHRGTSDIRQKLLRTPAEPNQIYRQDPVRMLRGIRFKHQKGFTLDEAAWAAILEQHDEMRLAAPKRLRDELNKMLKARTFGEGIHDLYISGLLTHVMPGLGEFFDQDQQLKRGREGISLWEHTRTALSVLTREHPHTDALIKLTVLVCDVMIEHGTQVAGDILFQAGIGKERVSSILHTVEQYKRFASFYKNREYIGKPRMLPHFINSLGAHKDDFRRMVRALNHKLAAEYQLPYEVFYDEGFVPNSRKPRRYGRNGGRNLRAGEAVPSASGESAPATNDPYNGEHFDKTAAQVERNHRRNIKRREQRKRARRMNRHNDNQSNPAE